MLRTYLVLLLSLAVAPPTWAETTRDLGAADQVTVFEGRKVALVVGNGRYRSAGRLEQAPEDARVIATALKDAGFDVSLHEDLNRTKLSSVIVDFEEQLRGAEVGFFYYAGHAIQLGDRNYLVPVDADIPSERYVGTYTVAVDEVMRSMDEAGSQLNLLVLDACRNNPFVQDWAVTSRSSVGHRGLATINAPSGFIVAYATGPGDVAADDGTYAAALALQMAIPGREISEVFRYVHQEVKDTSGSDQLPWVSEARGPGSFYPAGAPGDEEEWAPSRQSTETARDELSPEPEPKLPRVPRARIDKSARRAFDEVWSLGQASERQQALLELAQETADQHSADGDPSVDRKALLHYRRILREQTLSVPYTDLFVQASGWGGKSGDWGLISELGLAVGIPVSSSPVVSRRDRMLGGWVSLGLGKEHTTYRSDSSGSFDYPTKHVLDTWGNVGLGLTQSFGFLGAKGVSAGFVLGEGIAASVGSKESCATDCTGETESGFAAVPVADLQLLLRLQYRSARFLDVGLRYRPMLSPLIRPDNYAGANAWPGLMVRLGSL
jgi:hypothetical protein